MRRALICSVTPSTLFAETLNFAKGSLLRCRRDHHAGDLAEDRADAVRNAWHDRTRSHCHEPCHQGAGHFKVQDLPSVRKNVHLIKGWFDQTLPRFLAEHPEQAAYLHIDSDLYSSAKTVLDLFTPRIRTGTIIVFDEFFNYPGWQQGEYKAFQEFLSATGAQFENVGYSVSDEPVAVMIK